MKTTKEQLGSALKKAIALLGLTALSMNSASGQTQDPLRDHVYRLHARHSGQVLEVLGHKRNNGAVVGQWAQNDRTHQHWIFFPVPGSDAKKPYYFIVARHSGKLLDVLERKLEKGAPVGQWEYNGKHHQQWSLKDNGSGYFGICARHSRMCLDVFGRKQEKGAPVGQWEYNGGAHQQWRLIKVEKLKLPSEPDLDPPRIEEPVLMGHVRPEPADRGNLVGHSLLPFFMVNDPERRTEWKVENSLYYLLERRLSYGTIAFLYNNTDVEQSITYQEVKGWEDSEAEAFSVTTGISVSAEGAVFSAEISAELGYEKSSSFTETYQESVERPIKVPPHTSVAVWTDQSVLSLRRSDGTLVDEWTRSEGDYYFDQFPD